MGKIREWLEEKYYRIEDWFVKLMLRFRGAKLTPKGDCLYRYCKKIMNGELKEEEYIQSYEDEMEIVREALEEECHVEFTREEVAESLCRLFGVMEDI